MNLKTSIIQILQKFSSDIHSTIRKGTQIADIADEIAKYVPIDTIEKVEDFYDMADKYPSSSKEIFDTYTSKHKLALSLIIEELSELAASFGKEGIEDFTSLCTSKILKLSNEPNVEFNIREQVDALVDIRYVLDYSILSLNFKDLFHKGFTIIHRNNMTKFCRSETEVIAEMKMNPSIKTFKKVSNSVYVLYNKDGKVVKPSTYSPVDLNTLFDGIQINTND